MVRDNGGSFVFFITIAASSTDWSISYLSSVTAYKIKCNFQNTFSSEDATLLFSPTGYCRDRPTSWGVTGQQSIHLESQDFPLNGKVYYGYFRVSQREGGDFS